MNNKELRELARAWLKGAKILDKHNDHDGAVYLIGYVIEFSLKAIICKRLNLCDYPESGDDAKFFKTHNYDRLLTLSGMSDKISINGDQDLWQNWSKLTSFPSTTVRYEPVGTYNQQDVQELLEALESDKGFLTFAKKRW